MGAIIRFLLKGAIQTDYLIFNYAPLDDFKGNFAVSFDRLSDVNVSWGDVYRAVGTVEFGESKQIEGELFVDNLNLADHESIWGYLIPDFIQGKVNSVVKFHGDAHNPQIDGFIRSGVGKFMDLEFKKTLLNFSGDRKLLTMGSAKIYRTNSSLDLRGSVDFTKTNIFHDLYLESSEKIILWRGWDLSKREEDDSVFLKKRLQKI